MLSGGEDAGDVGSEGHRRPDGEAAAQSLGKGHDVGCDVSAMVSEPVTGAPHPTLHLVNDHEDVVGGRQLTYPLQGRH